MEATPTVGKLKANRRTETGKGVARKLRANGIIPAVCYGNGDEAIPLTVDPEELRGALDPEKGENTVIEMTIEGEGGPEVLQVMVKDYDLHALKKTVLHADFLKVDPNKAVPVRVPLLLEGKPEGVKVGGILHQVLRDLPMSCLPNAIPTSVTLDIAALEIGDGLRVSDLQLGEGISVDLPDTEALVQVAAPKAVEEEEVEEEGEEGEEGAEGAEGEGDGEKKEGADAEEKKE